MNVESFTASIAAARPPAGLSASLQALWYDASGDWNRAHKIVQGEDSKDAAAVHAYLHRKEGDLSNADYWYGRARRARSARSLDDEWRELAEALLSESAPDS
jgi:hypothetical protein